MNKKEVSIRVGGLVVLSLGLLLGLFLFLRKGFFSPQYNIYYIRFSDVTGLNLGAKVALSGVSIGSVNDITLLDSTTVRVAIKVEKGIKIPRGSSAHMISSLIGIGEQGIDISPPAIIVSYIHSNETLIGTKLSPLTAIFPEAQQMISEITATIRAIRGILTSEDTKGGMKSFFSSLDSNLNKIGALVETVHGVVKENRNNTHLALEELVATMEHLKSFSKEIAQGGYDQKMNHLFETAAKSLDKSRQLIENMNSLVKDPQWRDPFVKSMQNTEKITSSGINIAKDVELITKKGNIAADKAIHILDKADQLTNEAGVTMRELKNKWNVFSSPDSSRIRLSSDLNYEFKNRRTQINLNAKVPFLGNDYVVGLYDAFESNLLNLQVIKKMGDNQQIRFGVYAGKPGVGVDLNHKSGFSLHGDVYGLNHSCFDMKAGYKLNKDITAWLSFQDLFRQNIPSIGIGILK